MVSESIGIIGFISWLSKEILKKNTENTIKYFFILLEFIDAKLYKNEISTKMFTFNNFITLNLKVRAKNPTFVDGIIIMYMDNSKYKLLLVDDDEDILEFLSYNLKREGFQLFTANNGLEAIDLAKKVMPHLIVMDVMMPQMDGITAVEEIRKLPALDETMIVFLTARSEDYSQIAGFGAGADDYITKPIKPKLLVSRISAYLRRSTKQESPNVIEIKNLIINNEKFKVTLEGKEIILPKKEFKLLRLLASTPNKVFTRDEIFTKVWGDDVIVGDRTIDVHVRKIREKIGDSFIKTIKGVGYKLEEK